MAAKDIFDHDEKVRLLRSIQSMTQRGIISWDSTPVETDKPSHKRDDAFIAILEPAFGFYLSSVDRDGVAPYRLAIFKRKDKEDDPGGPIAVIEMTPLDEHGDEEENGLLDDLYKDVVRRVKRPDQTIRELFEAIDRAMGEPPF